MRYLQIDPPGAASKDAPPAVAASPTQPAAGAFITTVLMGNGISMPSEP